MKTTAIICEFNPLHSGHKKLIDYAHTFSDQVVCIMSGNFTQRGMPACADKFTRAKHAIKAGADLVIELPTIYATASAENFALGGVRIANVLKSDYLLFGSECGEINELTECAQQLDDEETNKTIVKELAQGISYPKAVSNAIGSELLNTPNNVLGIEYLRALKKTKSIITPITLCRENNYNGEALEYASSGTLRKNVQLRNKYSYNYVIKDIRDDIESKYCEFAVKAMSLFNASDLRAIEGITEGLENRIFKANKSNGYETMLEQIKSKRYTRLKLQRIILNAILNITKDQITTSKTVEPSIKILAVRTNKVNMLPKTDNVCDSITLKADRLYSALSGVTYPSKLIKID